MRESRRLCRARLWVAAVAALLSGCSGPAVRDDPVRVRELAVHDEPGALALPNGHASVKFAVIGDSGRGWRPQHEVAARMADYRSRFPYSFVLMAGDNIYEGPATARDYRVKFEEPYRPLLEAGVKFYAAIGNHDDPGSIYYGLFNMGGQRYYTFRRTEQSLSGITGGGVRFFALDSRSLDRPQLDWLSRELESSGKYGPRRKIPPLSMILVEDKRSPRMHKEDVIFERLNAPLHDLTLHLHPGQEMLLHMVENFPGTDYLDVLDALAQGPPVWKPGLARGRFLQIRMHDQAVAAARSRYTGYYNRYRDQTKKPEILDPDGDLFEIRTQIN